MNGKIITSPPFRAPRVRFGNGNGVEKTLFT